MRRLGVVALAVLTACTITPSEVDPQADIAITGSVSRQDGSPAPGIPITLVRHEGAVETFATVISLGVPCLDQGKQLSVCRGAKRAQTAEDGRFSITIKGADTQGFLGDASMLEATATLPRDDDEIAGPTATIRFLVQTERITLPFLAWEPTIQAVTRGRTGSVTWSAIPAAIIPSGIAAVPSRTSAIFERGTGEIVWTAPGRSETATFDARVLEDSTGSVSVAATWGEQTVPDERGRLIEMVLRSGRPAYRSHAGPAHSRGAGCGLRAADGSLVARAPCPLTDGAFDAPMGSVPCEGEPCITSNEVVVDWDAVRPLSLVVLRGCAASCTIETSPDGITWKLAATTAAGDVAVNVLEGVRARYVRVKSDEIESLREVSMWEPGDPPGDPRSILAEIGRGLLGPLDGSSESGFLPVAVAALLLALVGGALIATALQRRSPVRR